MVGRREAAAADAFRRRQLVGSLLRGHRADPDDLGRSVNRPLYAGVALAAAIAVGVGAAGYLRGGPPAGWLADGHLVVDRDQGGRYLSVHGTLHPVPNRTSLLLLTGGRPPDPVTVSHTELLTAAVGAPVGDPDAPDTPPRLARPGRLTACVGRTGRLQVVLGGTAPTGPAGSAALLDVGGRSWLVVDGRAHRLSGAAVLTALDYTAAQRVPAAARWLALLPAGSTLAPVVVRPAPVRRHRPVTATPGRLVVDAGTGQEYVTSAAGLRLVRTGITRLLLSDTAAPVRVPHAQVLSARHGRALGAGDLPASRPDVDVPAEGAVCTSTAAAGPVVYPALPVPRGDVAVVASPAPSAGPASPTATGTPRPPTGTAAPVQVRSPSEVGLLVRPRGSGDSLDDRHPDYLLAQGRAYPVGSTGVLGDLGYRQEQAVAVDPSWLGLFRAAEPLTAPGS